MKRLSKLGLVVTLFAALAAIAPGTAGAQQGGSGECTNPLKQALNTELPGNNRIWIGRHLCNVGMYAPNGFSSAEDLRQKVHNVVTRCDVTGQDNRLMVLSIIYWTGQVPVQNGPACSRILYENLEQSSYTGGSGPPSWPGMSWSKWYEENIEAGKSSALTTVGFTLNRCYPQTTSLAILETTGQAPDRANYPAVGGRGQQSSGQCNVGFYKNDYYSYERTKEAVARHAQQGQNCSNATITAAAQAVSGFKPLAAECVHTTDNSYWGDWNNTDAQMRTRYYNAQFCDDPWVGQIYAIYFNRGPNGVGSTGECNLGLYGFAGNTSRSYTTYVLLKDRIVNFVQRMNNISAGFESDGTLTLPGNVNIPPDGFSIIDDKGRATTGLGTASVIAVGAGHFQGSTPGVIAVGAGHITIPQGGAVIAVGAGHVIAVGAGHVIAVGAGHIQYSKPGAPVIAVGAGHFATGDQLKQLTSSLASFSNVSLSQLAGSSSLGMMLGGANLNRP